MDFSNRGTQQPQTVAPSAHTAPAAGGKKNKSDKSALGRVGVILGVVAVVILLLGLIGLFMAGNSVKSEATYVDSGKLQAVFLNTGQVYFGNIKTLNNRYFVLTNIYYLQTSSTGTSSSSTNVSLVKLGCELHEPYDQMIINRSQVTFWENLQDNGQVAKAVSTFEKNNPSGQKCADQSTSGSTSGSSVQNAGSGSTSGSSTTTTKP